ncbi:3-isopropylmalate dehydratase small subunit [Microbacterium sp. No. 7]|uniref:3-isopropylmalate dehydratase small subunit n=1 Tax=Microbacterium sp. No. 7 TaxID=1714373 RepID=UPI0009E7F286|nr:3-isopropylmalate dehydratase small subunit [Microbacterium sp. No. 7]
MRPFTQHSGIAAPLRRSNVDTDQILPARHLQRVQRDGFGEFLFARWREDPDFVLNQERFRTASILVAEPDFGTGSSREHAVWAIQQAGFRVVVSERFGDIFRANSANAGLLTAAPAESDVERLLTWLEGGGGVEVHVDLRACVIDWGAGAVPFDIPRDHRRQLLEGRDAIEQSLAHLDEIEAYEARRSPVRPFVSRVRSVVPDRTDDARTPRRSSSDGSPDGPVEG